MKFRKPNTLPDQSSEDEIFKRSYLRELFEAILYGYSEILFMRSRAVGLLLMAVTFISPRTGLSGLLAVLSVWLFTVLIRFDRRFMKVSSYFYNPLLVGMSVGYLFDFSLRSMLLVMVSGILTFFVTFVSATVLDRYALPVLSIPFALVSIVLYLAAIKYLAATPSASIFPLTPSAEKNLKRYRAPSSPESIRLFPSSSPLETVSRVNTPYRRLLAPPPPGVYNTVPPRSPGVFTPPPLLGVFTPPPPPGVFNTVLPPPPPGNHMPPPGSTQASSPLMQLPMEQLSLLSPSPLKTPDILKNINEEEDEIPELPRPEPGQIVEDIAGQNPAPLHTNKDEDKGYIYRIYRSVYNALPIQVSSFFSALGTLFFTPDIFAGMLIAVMMLVHSRILFFYAVAGFYFGVLFHSAFLSSVEAAFFAEYSFNYILASIAVGSVFTIPSIRSLFLSFCVVGIAVILTDMVGILLSIYRIPAFVLPFNASVIPALYILRSIGFKEYAWSVKASPELTLFSYLTSERRFSGWQNSIYLPFSGTWSVYQGFDGKWTHNGIWRYAYDFVIRDKEGISYKNQGYQLEDYFAFKKPVLSPVRGYVIRAVSHFKDNQINEVDTDNNWGNYLVIQANQGFYVELSHFAEGSLKVKTGDYVEVGQMIGHCGNSGYSPEPHIHVQVQEVPEIGAGTKPFTFVNYKSKEKLQWYALPDIDETVESIVPDKSINSILSFSLDQIYEYEYICNEEKTNETFTVCMDHVSGKFYFRDSRNNRLYFARESAMFYFYDYQGSENAALRLLYSAVPRIPLSLKTGYVWYDSIPDRYIKINYSRLLESIKSVFFSSSIFVDGKWEFNQDAGIKGCYGLNREQLSDESVRSCSIMDISAQLHEYNGIREIIVNRADGSVESLKLKD